MPANAKVLKTDCRTIQRLAQEHADDMARRDRLDHAGFATRAKKGARPKMSFTGIQVRR
jgi:uncharacterized protein YkwD